MLPATRILLNLKQIRMIRKYLGLSENTVTLAEPTALSEGCLKFTRSYQRPAATAVGSGFRQRRMFIILLIEIEVA